MDSNMMTRKVFSEAEELFLVVDINKVAKMNYGLAKKGVRSLVYKFAMANIKNRPVKWDEDETAGEEWLRLFMTRHTAMLIIKKPEKTNLLRAIAFNPTNVETFLKNLEDVQGGQISEVGGCISETNDRRELRCFKQINFAAAHWSFLFCTIQGTGGWIQGPFQIHHPQRRPRIEKERSHRSGGRGGSRHAPVLYARGGHRDPDGGQRLQDHRRELCLGRDAKRHRESSPTFQPIPRRHVRTICTSQNAYNDDNLDNSQNGTQPHAEQEIEANEENNATLYCGRGRGEHESRTNFEPSFVTMPTQCEICSAPAKRQAKARVKGVAKKIQGEEYLNDDDDAGSKVQESQGIDPEVQVTNTQPQLDEAESPEPPRVSRSIHKGDNRLTAIKTKNKQTNAEKSLAEYFEAKKAHLDKPSESADEKFLLSLLPDINLMNAHQKRRLKREILELIDKILLEDNSSDSGKSFGPPSVGSLSRSDTQSRPISRFRYSIIYSTECTSPFAVQFRWVPLSYFCLG
ncbi:hypothetical protein MML48_1g09562 [Holotrichia oblita]|uniref:Uncharacterized protein n=1 Tax=Holotrichia oblita TaxID=644536 RepID=A0ACB9TZR9_HOLOL|nr:hypothetical protein MML48_1g09562 [Holotrichia oblita]